MIPLLYFLLSISKFKVVAQCMLPVSCTASQTYRDVNSSESQLSLMYILDEPFMP